ncbi:MAG: Uma2 family endonuclease [Campylobacterales bacterium]|nr:Uma2 family endonuclease [Campylobacterales bacterium]
MGALNYLPHYTYDDYKLWEGKWELYEGVPIAMSPAPMITHQGIASMFIAQLTNAIEACEACMVLGEEDYKLSDDTVLRPDVVLICNEPHDAYITKAPEIVVEVLSKFTAKNDEGYKFYQYEAEKVLYYVLVYPDELIAKIYTLKEGKYDKVGDFSTESYLFDKTTCKAFLDFEKIFRRFRKKAP